MVRRPGHSLVELIVALTVLGASLAAVSATITLSSRRTREAVQAQEATALAASVMDSLLAHPDPRSGTARSPWGTAGWEVVEGVPAGGRVIRLRVRAVSAERTVAELQSLWIPAPPAAPGSAS